MMLQRLFNRNRFDQGFSDFVAMRTELIWIFFLFKYRWCIDKKNCFWFVSKHCYWVTKWQPWSKNPSKNNMRTAIITEWRLQLFSYSSGWMVQKNSTRKEIHTKFGSSWTCTYQNKTWDKWKLLFSSGALDFFSRKSGSNPVSSSYLPPKTK